MKRLLILAAASLIAMSAPAHSLTWSFPAKKGRQQQWLTAGIRGTVNNTWLLNKNMQQDKNMKLVPSIGFSGGIMIGYHMNNIMAINVEGLYSTYSQRYKDGEQDTITWTARTDLAYIEIPILLRFDFENYKYLEFGVRLGMLQDARYSYTNDLFPAFNYSNEPAKDPVSGESHFEKKNTALLFGWGGGIWGNGGLLISGGLRFTYGLTDIISEAGGRGQDYMMSDGSSKAYTPTHTATVGFHLIADFDIGWFVSSSCGRNHKFMLFSH
ncbi:MAG: porin family protein [Bacteroidota bacterium]